MNSIDHLIHPKNVFYSLDEKMKWIEENLEELTMKVYLDVVQRQYEPKWKILYKYRIQMIGEDVLEWLEHRRCDENGVPTCVKCESPGIYSL